jgi:hypothetical protein
MVQKQYQFMHYGDNLHFVNFDKDNKAKKVNESEINRVNRQILVRSNRIYLYDRMSGKCQNSLAITGISILLTCPPIEIPEAPKGP